MEKDGTNVDVTDAAITIQGERRQQDEREGHMPNKRRKSATRST
jgi:hypothetical protein